MRARGRGQESEEKGDTEMEGMLREARKKLRLKGGCMVNQKSRISRTSVGMIWLTMLQVESTPTQWINTQMQRTARLHLLRNRRQRMQGITWHPSWPGDVM